MGRGKWRAPERFAVVTAVADRHAQDERAPDTAGGAGSRTGTMPGRRTITAAADRPPQARLRASAAVPAGAAPVLLAVSLLLALGGCSTAPTTGPATEPPPPTAPALWPDAGDGQTASREGCGVLSDPALPDGVFLVALNEEVRPDRAPLPHNAAERLVFGHLYETLVRVDCSGELLPGLADHWACSPDSTEWVFRLREDAVFWDGARVTAADVVMSWRARQASAPQEAGGDGRAAATPWNWLNSQSRSISVRDARRLAIQLPEPQAHFPWLLAHPALSVAVAREGWTWPVGSGPCRLRATDPAPLPDLECRPNLHHPDAPVWKRLTFRVRPGADARDLVGDHPSLLLTRDLEAVRFYDDLPGYFPEPLPWNRLYLLVCPPEANPGGTTRWTAAVSELDPADDLTEVAARRWDSVAFPGGGIGPCPQLSGPVADDNVARLDWGLEEHRLDADTIIFPAHDPAARELAHRLGALAGSPVRTVALSAPELSFALQWQMAGACVVAQPQQYPTCCLQLATLLGSAAWLQKLALTPPAPAADTLGQAARLGAGRCDPASALRSGGWAQPLAVTRPWLIARGRLGGLSLDYDGLPRLTGLGRSETEPQP